MTAPRETPEPGDDPRYAELEPEFARIIADLCRAMARSASLRRGRATHTVGIMARGELELLAAPELGPHAWFVPGRRYSVTLRHASFKGFADDAVWDGRSASLRVFASDADEPGDEGLCDLILSNGRTFVLGDALIFHRWFSANLQERAKILEEYPPFAPSFAEFVRSPDSFTDLDYYSQITYRFVNLDGRQAYLRFRLTAPEPRPDSGFVDPSKLQLPLDYVPRAADDTRSPSYLRDELRARVEAEGIHYRLQVQLRDIVAADDENQRALDVTEAWPESQFPFIDVARLRLDRIVDEQAAAAQHLNVGKLPAGLSLIYTRSARHPASIAQLRSIVYDAAAAARLERPYPPALQRLLDAHPASAAPLAPGLHEDTLFDELGPELRTTVATLARELHRRAAALGGLPNTSSGIALRGRLQIIRGDEVPAAPMFARGQSYPITLRYGNEREFGDDAILDGRYALLRLHPADARADGSSAALLDLVLFSGAAAPLASARQLARWLIGSQAERAQVLADSEGAGERLRRFIRNPDSYTELHYHGWATHEYVDVDGQRQLARYRLVRPDALPDTGAVDPELVALPLDFVPRRPDDPRPPSYLRDRVRAELERGPIVHILQIQRCPVPETVAARQRAADPTQPWPSASSPWRDLARLELDAELRGPIRRDVRPERQPEGLRMLRAYSDTEPGSMPHLFAITNDIQIRLLERRPLAEPLARMIREEFPDDGAGPASEAPTPRKVAVIGGGAAGLTAAFELQKRGHQVTVFEREPSIGGKSAAFEIDGRSFDLGTHICTNQYRNVRQLAAELGCETELLTPLRTLDVARRALYAPGKSFMSELDSYARLLAAKAERFPGIAKPGLHHESRALARSLPEWIAGSELRDLLEATGLDVGYTSSGYGFLDDPELAAVYYLKFVELSGFLDPNPQEDYEGEWTIAGCFMNLWRQLAAQLADLRCGVEITAVERDADAVRVRLGDELLEFDDLILAVPLERSLEFLDASAEERELFGRIRHNTYFTTVASAIGLPRDGFYMLQQHSVDRRALGRCTAFHHRYADSDVYTFYAYGGPALDEAAILRMLAQDVETLGGELVEVHAQRRWNFFPHVALADVEAGYFEKLEALQGRRRTYYTGSLLAFELVECVVGYSRDLIARQFVTLEGQPGITRAPTARPGARRVSPRSEDSIRTYLVEQLARELQISPAQVDPAAALEAYALDSVVANSLVGSFSEWLGFRVTPALIVEHPTINAIAAHLARG